MTKIQLGTLFIIFEHISVSRHGLLIQMQEIEFNFFHRTVLDTIP